MTCRELTEFLLEYVDGLLPRGQHEEFERHLGLCRPCVTYLQHYRETIKLGKCLCDDPDSPVSEGVPDDLVAAILAARDR